MGFSVPRHCWSWRAKESRTGVWFWSSPGAFGGTQTEVEECRCRSWHAVDAESREVKEAELEQRQNHFGRTAGLPDSISKETRLTVVTGSGIPEGCERSCKNLQAVDDAKEGQQWHRGSSQLSAGTGEHSTRVRMPESEAAQVHGRWKKRKTNEKN